jgi:hypothetical protein
VKSLFFFLVKSLFFFLSCEEPSSAFFIPNNYSPLFNPARLWGPLSYD